MSTEEKIELGKRIRKLPEEALNRIVEIITRRKLASQSSDRITMKLGELVPSTSTHLSFLNIYASRLLVALLSMPDPRFFSFG